MERIYCKMRGQIGELGARAGVGMGAENNRDRGRVEVKEGMDEARSCMDFDGGPLFKQLGF